MKDAFSTLHPIINFSFFTTVILFTMFMMQPVFLMISFLASITYSIYLNGRRAVLFNLCAMLPLLILAAVMNPLFNHEGATILTYFPGGNPLTLESLIYGLAAATMFVTVIIWFSCYNAVMTSDKFIYLFGRIIPAISLVLSMILRFVPKFKAQIKVVSNGQKCMGRDVTNGNFIQRSKNGMKSVSIMTTWALENGIETADSMRSRGYGLSGRTSFSIFRFDTRDYLVAASILIPALFAFIVVATGKVFIAYYPWFIMNETTLLSVVTYIAYGILCFFPMMIDITEDIKWHVMKSKI